MNTTQAQQKALNDALVTPVDRLEFGKCNMRLKTDIKPKEATFQVVLDALALTPFYRAFLITADFCPKIPRQKFEDLPLEHDILSFIRDLGHTGDITYLTDVNVDYLHQPWRAFATVINKCISRHKDTQVYGTILPKELTNQAMLESNAYKTYYAFASGEKAPKPKYVRKKADPDTSPKQKPVQATKGTRLKSKAKVTKPDKKKQLAKKPKAKGLAVLSKVIEVDTQSKVHDEQQQKSSGTDEGTGTILGVPDVPIYESKSEKESWGDSEDEDDTDDDGDNDDDGESDDDNDDNDDDDANVDDKQEGDDTNDDDEETNSDRTELDRIKIPIFDQSTTEYYEEEEEKIDDEETMYDDEDDEVTKELYEDVNVNLGNEDTEMTNADQGASDEQNVSQESGFKQVEEDAHVTLTPVLDTQKADEPVQSSSVSSNFTSKLLNLENPSLVDNEIASLMETSTRHAMAVPENTSGFTITIPPPPPFFNAFLRQVTPTLTLTTSKATTSFPFLLDFSSVFRFNDRVTNLEKDLKNVTKSVEPAVLTRSSLQPTSTYEAATSLSEFELTKILIDKMEKNRLYDKADYKKKLYDALNESYNTDKDLFDSYGEIFLLKRSRDEKDKDRDPSAGSDRGMKRRKSSKDAESSRDSRSKENKSSSTSKDASQSQHKSSGKSAQAEEPIHTVKDSGMQQDQEFVTRDNDEQPANKETWINQVAHAKEPPTSFDELNDTLFDFSAFVMNRLKIPNLTQEILFRPAFNLLKGTCKSITELEYHLEECSKAITELLD
ncbi:hypothetical protein Tco_1234586 [Tanacetum coccineum]